MRPRPNLLQGLFVLSWRLTEALASPYISPWSLNTPPPPNATHNLLFDSISSLLATWSNTRYRNGHTIVPGTIPAGTFLYHGTNRKEIPSTPEWTALDSEFSYIFCHTKPGEHAGGNGGCWHLTLLVTRPLKVLYFDGSSASKVFGPLDAQDLIVYGDEFSYSRSTHRNASGTHHNQEFDEDDAFRLWAEPERLKRLCAWGEKYDLDGFVRMQASFEVMLCNFTSPSLTPHSFLNLVSELESSPTPSFHPLSTFSSSLTRNRVAPHDDHHDDTPSQETLLKIHRALESGLVHAHTPEPRVHLDLTRLVSFYDPQLFPSLAESRVEPPPEPHKLRGSLTDILHHRQLTRGKWRVGPLGGISRDDREALMKRLDEVLSSPAQESRTGYDWQSIYGTFKKTYAERLEVLHHILHFPFVEEDPRVRLRNAHTYVDGMLTPYILYNLTYEEVNWDLDWAEPVYETCTTHSLPPLPPSTTRADLGYGERLLYTTLEGTAREVCRVLVRLWAVGIEGKLHQPPSPLETTEDASALLEEYRLALNSLLVYLDWSSPWIKCTSTSTSPPSPPPGSHSGQTPLGYPRMTAAMLKVWDGCLYEERCYLPTWPLFKTIWPPMQFPVSSWTDGASEKGGETPDISEWEFPQPKCLRRVAPYKLPY